MSKKEEKRAARQAAARRSLRLHTFCLILAPVIEAWHLGMQGGGVQAGITFPPIEPPQPLRRFIRQQCARVVKWRGLVMDQLPGEKSAHTMGTQFFSDAYAKLQLVERAAEAAAPHASAYELLTMKTYLVCAAIHDLMIIDPACASYPLRMLRQVLGTLADLSFRRKPMRRKSGSKSTPKPRKPLALIHHETLALRRNLRCPYPACRCPLAAGWAAQKARVQGNLPGRR